jgi:hypothetical protein
MALLFWQNAQYNPVDWQHIKLSILPKKDDLADPNKWHGIGLGDIQQNASPPSLLPDLPSTSPNSESMNSMAPYSTKDAPMPH